MSFYRLPSRTFVFHIILILFVSTPLFVHAQILAWDFNGHSGDSTSVFATTRNANLQTSQITRGSGLIPGSPAISNTYGSESFTANGTRTDAIANNDYVAFTVSSTSGYFFSITSLDANFRRSSTGPNNFEWQYSTDGTTFTTIGSSFTFSDINTDGVAQSQIPLTSIPALQNATIIYFRLYAWGATSASGTFALGRPTTPTNDLAIGGTVFNASALAFDGANDRISTTGTMLATPPTQFTIEWWLYPLSRTDFNQGLGIGNNWGDFAFHTTATGSVYVGTDMTNRLTPAEIPANTVVTNMWQHFTFTFNNGEGRFYKDGVLIARKTGMQTPQNFNTFYMGVQATSSYIHGYLDEVRVWSTARTCEELRQYRNCELTGNESNLLCYFQFNQGIASGANSSVTTLLNRVTGGLTGTLTNFDLSNGNSTSNWVSQSAVTLGNTCPATITFPEINLQGNGNDIVSGATTTSAANFTNFGNVSTSLQRTFVIQNTGTAALTISSVSSSNAEFVVGSTPTTINAGSSGTFTITFTPTTSGNRTGTITINNNDCDEGTYTFAVQGRGPIIVTTTANSGAGSLRQAITDANALSGADIIAFNIGGGGAQSITVSTSDLPTITEALTIDGSTQPGYTSTPLITVGDAYTGSIIISNTTGAVTLNALNLSASGSVSGICVNVSSSSLLTVTNCNLRNRTYALFLTSCTALSVTNNDFTNSGQGSGYAIQLQSINGTSGSGTSITGNTFGGASTRAINLEGCSNMTIAPSSGQIQVGTQLKEFVSPLRVNNGSNITITGLDLSPTTAQNGYLECSSVTNLTVTNNSLQNRLFGILINTCTSVTATGNNFTNSGFSSGYAMQLQSINGTAGSGSVFNNNTFGGASSTRAINLESCSNLTVLPSTGTPTGAIQVGTQLKEFVSPLRVSSGSNITITGLDLSPTTAQNGYLECTSVTNLTVTNNSLQNRLYGVFINTCTSVTATGNNFTNSGFSSGYAMQLQSINGTAGSGSVFNNNTFGGASSTRALNLESCSNLIVLPSTGTPVGAVQVGTQLKEFVLPLRVSNGSNITITGLDLSPTTAQNGYLECTSVNGLTITNNLLQNRLYGVFINSCTSVTATGNNFTNSGFSSGYAMQLQSINGTAGSGSVFNNNTFGGASSTRALNLESCSNLIVLPSTGTPVGAVQVGTQLKEFVLPLRVSNGSNITITGLDLSPTTAQNGYLECTSVNGLTITNNLLQNRVYGVFINTCTSVTVTGNNFTNSGFSNGYSMYLISINASAGTGSTFTGNIFGGTTNAGLFLSSCSNMTVAPSTGTIQVGSQLKPFNLPLNVSGGSNLIFSGLDFEKVGAVGSAIDFNSVNTITITNCIFRNRLNGLQIQNCTNVIATGNDLTDAGVSNGYAIYLQNVNGNNASIVNNTIGGVTTAGLYMGSCSNFTVAPSTGQIQVGTFLKPLTTPMFVTGGTNLTFTGLDFERIGAVGNTITFQGVNTISVTNCILKNRTYGLLLQNCSNIIATGNDLTNSGVSNGYAIYLDGNNTTSMDISNNTIAGTTTRGVYANNMTGFTIGGTTGKVKLGTQLASIVNGIYLQSLASPTVDGLDLGRSGTPSGNAIEIQSCSGTVTIQNSKIGGHTYGIVFNSSSSTASITCNAIYSNTTGVLIQSIAVGSAIINNNNFKDNTNSINNSTTAPNARTIDATTNYWLNGSTCSTTFGLGTFNGYTNPGGTGAVTTVTSPLSSFASCAPLPPVPSIDVRGNLVSIPNGDITPSTSDFTDFGFFTTSTFARTFKIHNTGTIALTISSITSTGTNATEFVVSGAPTTIAPLDSATFVVTFTPGGNGTRTSTITVNSNDCPNAAYSFAVQGGRQASALAFDGTDDYVEVANSTTLENYVSTGALTVEFDIYPAAFTGTQTPIAKRNAANSAGYIFEYFTAGQLQTWVNMGGSWQNAPVNLTLDQWQHIAVVAQAGVGIKTYVNGVLTNSVNATGSFNASSNVLRIGANTQGAPNSYFAGKIDNVRLWNTARTCDQIAQLRNCELAGNETGLVAYYKFNQGVADGSNTGVTTLTNAVSGGVDGTLVGFSSPGLTNGNTTSNWTSPGGVTTGTSCPTTVTAPEINLQGGTPLTNILDGATTTSSTNGTDFGKVTTTAQQTFTIQNTGTSTLTISSIAVAGLNASEFVVSGAPSSVSAGGSATFTVTFTPTAAGIRVATITINNTDCDEAAYDFAVRGRAVTPAALSFDGTNDYVSSANTQSIMGSTPTTIEFWAKGALQGIGFPLCINTADVAVRFHSSNRVQLERFGGTTYDMGVVNDACWHHYAFAWNGTTVYGYVDGQPAPNPSATVAFPATSATGTFYVGVYNLQYFYTGLLDEVRVWNTFRTQSQIQSTMYSELVGNEANLIRYYNFNDGTPNASNTSNTTLYDNSSVGNNGTLNGFAYNGSSSNWTTTGAMIQYPEVNIQGNGTNNIIDGTTTTSTTNGTDFGAITTTSLTRTFTIQNTGSSDLTISTIGVSGSNASEFVVGGITLPATITNGSSTTFTVTFTPTANGTRTATITVNNNDCDEAVYDFAVSGGRQASALAFDGTNDRVSIASQPLANLNQFSVEAWVNIRNTGGGTIYSEGLTSSLNPMLSVSVQSDGRLELVLRNSSSVGLATTTSAGLIPFGQWKHVAFVRTSSTTALLYIDGTQVGSYTFTNPGAISVDVTNIGARQRLFFDGFMNGSLDDVRLWNTARTCDEISQLRSCELAGNETGLVAYYKFNQGVADGSNTGVTTLTNAVSGGVDGTLVGFSSPGLTNGNTTSNWTSPGGVTTGTSCPTTVTAPEINLTGNSTNILDGQTTPSTANHTDFGAITTTSLTRTYTIQNTGSSDLTVSTIGVSGTNASEFVVGGITLPATITNGSPTTFTVTFTPTANGTRTATITVNNNDCDEAAYDFVVRGGRQGSALAFDGTNDYVTIGTPLTSNSSYTKEAWINLTSSGSNKNIISSQSNPFWVNNRILSAGNGGNLTSVQDPTQLALNTWVHVAVSYDATTSTMRLYKNGILVAQNTSAPAFVSEATNIGSHYGAGISPFQGSIDEVRIWNTVRTCDEISQLRSCELAGNETGLVAYYKFNQGVADGSNTGVTTLTNAVSGGVDGTLVGFSSPGLTNGNTTSNWTSPGGVTTGTSCPATITAPEINLQGNTTDISDGQTTPSTANHTDFGSSSSRTFTIQNTGSSALTVNTIVLSGTHASEYSISGITLPATINASSSTTFVVNFSPAGSGFRTAIVTVNNNDCDEAAYDFAVRALGTPATFTIGFDRRVLHADQRMKTINLSVSIVNGSNPSWLLKSITSSEADAGVADNDQANDIQNAALNTADTQFDLRAERIGRGGNGRVYLVTLQLTDAGVNRDTTFAVVVPVNLGLSRQDATGSSIANVVLAQTSVNPNTSGNVALTVTSPSSSTNRVQVRVFNSKGKDIQWLHNAVLNSGTTSLTWNVTDRQGATVPNGVYYIQVLGDGVISAPLPVRINR